MSAVKRTGWRRLGVTVESFDLLGAAGYCFVTDTSVPNRLVVQLGRVVAVALLNVSDRRMALELHQIRKFWTLGQKNYLVGSSDN